MSTPRFAVRRSLVLAAALALAGSLLAVTGAQASSVTRPIKCLVANGGLVANAARDARYARYTSLQAAVDAAHAGDTLTVKGTCVGNTVIGKSLTIVGKASPMPGRWLHHSRRRFIPATLDGHFAGPVVTIALVGVPATVTLRDLVVTHGAGGGNGGGIVLCPTSCMGPLATTLTLTRSTIVDNRSLYGGGIGINEGGTLIMDRGSVVSRNAATSGGGIANAHGGTLILNDTSSVDHNTAAYGAGIDFGTAGYPAVILNDTSSVHDNTATGDGGGISIADAGVELNDASSIHDNTAARGGGIFSGFAASATINGQGSIHDNDATTAGGGIWKDNHSSLTNCVPGVNVLHNLPDDIFVEP